MNTMRATLVLSALFLTEAAGAIASTWYVNGSTGSDGDACLSPSTPCKTIGHAISLGSSGDSIMVAGGTYAENLNIPISLNITGSGANTTIIDGRHISSVVTVPNSNVHVILSNLTIRNGAARYGAGLSNSGTLTIVASDISGNSAAPPNNCFLGCGASGGGIYNFGTLTLNNTNLTGNTASASQFRRTGAGGGGILNGNSAILTINDSTLSSNSASAMGANGGGLENYGTATINNSTITGNLASGIAYASGGGGISNAQGTVTISSSTVSGNSSGIQGAGFTLHNSIVANNGVANCSGTVSSGGYNLSSDGTCSFSGPGDLNNADPKLGTLGSYGGLTQTIPLLSGSVAIDAGNPSGCTDGQGHLLKTDQRGMPRPDAEDKSGCDIGAYEKQSD